MGEGKSSLEEGSFRISGSQKASGVGSDAGNVGIGGWTLGLGTVLGPRDVWDFPCWPLGISAPSGIPAGSSLLSAVT